MKQDRDALLAMCREVIGSESASAVSKCYVHISHEELEKLAALIRADQIRRDAEICNNAATWLQGPHECREAILAQLEKQT